MTPPAAREARGNLVVSHTSHAAQNPTAIPVTSPPATRDVLPPERPLGTFLNPWVIDNYQLGSASLPTTLTTGEAVDAVLERILTEIRGYPTHTVFVTGTTDYAGSRESNRALAWRRARAVADELVRRGFTDRSRLRVSFSYPFARYGVPPADASGRSPHLRRVEVSHSPPDS